VAPMIRLAGPEDRPGVEAVVAAAYRHYIARIGAKPGPMLDDYAQLIVEGRVHVLEEEPSAGSTAIVGVLVLVPEDAAMLLDNIAIDPQAQGRGYGRRLMLFAEETAREAGYASIRLYTHVLMHENIALYTRAGFVETHRGREKGFERVYMTKSLIN
jgi:ribosomal protein S18 acetylase RimI-like enzyme